MKKSILIACALSAFTASGLNRHSEIPDLPPDATTQQYLAVQRSMPQIMIAPADGLDPVVAAGQRSLNFLKYMNSFRPGDPISFTNKKSQSESGIPIDKPSEYNPELLLAKFTKWQNDCPPALKEILLNNGAFTKDPPIPLEDYITFSRALDKNYQTSIRWRLMQPYLEELALRRSEDVRGYHFLSTYPERASKLANYAGLRDDEKAHIYEWLLGVCQNDTDNSLNDCKSKLDGMIAAKADLEPYYQQLKDAGQALWEAYFQIPAGVARTDFSWANEDGGKSRLITPFKDPMNDDVRYFLQYNIQLEWNLGDWHLEFPFTADAKSHVVFEAGSTPHVNGMGGDTITMDANQPLTEYDAQWTIRHEYGHVLGFPDCYVEFYVSERNVIINYQLDTSDIMCSRAGHVKDTNVSELTRVYKK
jgi:hypothetical protein